MSDQYEEEELEFIYNLLDCEEDTEQKQGRFRTRRARDVDRDQTAGVAQPCRDYLDGNPTYPHVCFKRRFSVPETDS